MQACDIFDNRGFGANLQGEAGVMHCRIYGQGGPGLVLRRARSTLYDCEIFQNVLHQKTIPFQMMVIGGEALIAKSLIHSSKEFGVVVNSEARVRIREPSCG